MSPVVDARELRGVAERPKPRVCPTCGNQYSADALFCSLDGAPLTSSLRAVDASVTDPYLGREILGHIEILQLVGIGAMGRVYRAFQRGIDRNVAVKILHRELSANEALVTRFHREAKVVSRIAHPNVVHVLLAGQLPDGAMYIVMEYLDGLSLQSALAAAGGAMPPPRALHIAAQLCDAVGEAHAQGIVHRDLKPENVMLVHRADDADFVKVLDFGIARLNWGEPSVATAAGLIFGTARYISPEGARGEPVTPRGDVYSVATVLYQMLAGRTPFDADHAAALLAKQVHDPPPPLEGVARAASVPAPVARVIMANLAKAPSGRAEDGRAFGRALLEAARMAELGGSPSGVKTVKWSAAQGLEATLAAFPAAASRSPSSVEITLAGDRVKYGTARTRGTALGIGFLCIGALGVAALLGRAGRVSGALPQVSAEPIRDEVPAAPLPAASPGLTFVAPAPSGGGPDTLIAPVASTRRATSASAVASPASMGAAASAASASTAASAASASATASAARAILEASSSRPELGQPVDFSARVVTAAGGSRAKPDAGRFRISGPGLATGTELPASDDGSGIFRTMFTFLQTGRFEVEFSARAAGASVRAIKVIVVGESALPLAPPPATTTSSSPNGTTKWL